MRLKINDKPMPLSEQSHRELYWSKTSWSWAFDGVITISDNGEPPLLSRGECENWPVASWAVYLKLNPVGK